MYGNMTYNLIYSHRHDTKEWPMSTRGRARDATAQKQERLEARISSEQKALLVRAAKLQGRTLSDFVVSSVQQAAQDVIHAHTILTLTAQDSRMFVEALLNPPPPNDRLRTAAAKYQRDSTE